jgi:hypothetical protein
MGVPLFPRYHSAAGKVLAHQVRLSALTEPVVLASEGALAQSPSETHEYDCVDMMSRSPRWEERTMRKAALVAIGVLAVGTVIGVAFGAAGGPYSAKKAVTPCDRDTLPPVICSCP